jgi:hypothetical protein
VFASTSGCQRCGVILSAVEQVCREDATVEAVIADVCRHELLVGIEAIADLWDGPSRTSGFAEVAADR